MDSKPTLLCAAMPFGYGPAAKLVTLAQRLRDEWRLVFAGRGSALELVEREREPFDAVIACPAGGEPPRALLSDARAVLSLMDRDAAEWAARAGRPLAVVDSLLWMRPAVPEPLRSARLYIAQAFPGLEPSRHRPTPLVVGPIVAARRVDAARAGPPERGGLVVNLGGSAAPDGREALYAGYARFVVQAVLDAGLPERFGRVTVLGGTSATAALAARPLHGRAANGSAGRALGWSSRSHADARDAMAGAAAVLTAPGLTATLECFHDGVPTWWLPPQNYSQWCILRRLRQAGLAGDALHWEDLPAAPQLDERRLPHETTDAIRRAIERGIGDAATAAQLRAQLDGVGRDAQHRSARQTAFYQSLGPSGVESVVTALGGLGDHARRRTRRTAPPLPASMRRPDPAADTRSDTRWEDRTEWKS